MAGCSIASARRAGGSKSGSVEPGPNTYARGRFVIRPLLAPIVMALGLLPQAALGQSPVADPPPLDDAPKWYKGNLHTHSLWSDGNDYPEMIVDFYARRDYNFLALSD